MRGSWLWPYPSPSTSATPGIPKNVWPELPTIFWDKRIVIILMADRIKETMLSDQASLLHYAATQDASDLQEFSGLGRATIEQMDALRRETASPRSIKSWTSCKPRSKTILRKPENWSVS